MIKAGNTPEEIDAEIEAMFKPTAAQEAEFNSLRQGYFAERREHRRLLLAAGRAVLIVVGGASLGAWLLLQVIP